MKNKLQKMISAVIAMMMFLSCFSVTALAVDKTPTFDAQSGETASSLTVSTDRANRTFELYQIFYGDYEAGQGQSEKTLTDIQWGVSIKSGVTYDLSADLITALKADKLPDGSTDNPLKAEMVTLHDNPDATDIANALVKAIPEKANDVTQATYADAFARIVGSVIANYEKTNSKTVEKKTCDSLTPDTGYVFSGIHDGYYVISDVTDIADIDDPATLTTQMLSKYIIHVAGNVTVDMKIPGAPTVDKVLTNEDGTTDSGRFQDAAVGDTVYFKLTGEVPDMSAFNKYYYQFNDTLSEGLDFDETTSNITVKVGDTTLTKVSSEEGPNATGENFYVKYSTINVDGKYVHNLDIVLCNMKQYTQGTAITVTYGATLNEKAVIGKGSDSEVNSNYNKVYVQYSNDPKHVYEGENEPASGETKYVGATGETKTYVYTTGIKLVKQNGETLPLAGAKFQIEGIALNKVVVVKDVFNAVGYKAGNPDLNSATAYYLLSDGTYTTTVPADTSTASTSPTPVMENVKYSESQGVYTADVNGTYYKKSSEYSYVAVDQASDGDTYEQDYVVYVKETKTTVDTVAEHVSQTVEVGSDGILNLNGLKAGEYTITEIEAPVGYNKLDNPISVKIEWQQPAAGAIANGCTWTFKVDMSGGTNYESKAAESDGTLKLVVVNQTGSTLPHTGGIGTTIFYVLGSVLVLGAAILLITMRRMRKYNNN